MALQIAHQVVRTAWFRALRKASADGHSSKKTRMAPCRIPSLFRSRGLSGSPGRSPPEQPTDTAVALDLESTSRGTRNSDNTESGKRLGTQISGEAEQQR